MFLLDLHNSESRALKDNSTLSRLPPKLHANIMNSGCIQVEALGNHEE